MFTSLACILLAYHALAFLLHYFAAKTMLCSGHLSIMCALLEPAAMSQAVRTSASKTLRHAGWCIILIIIMIAI